MNKLLITGCLLATAFAAVAMPTKKELAAAQKQVEDIIAPDVKALNAGRKTVKDVADIQMKLAADAQSEAEKYLLLQSAFKLYSRGEEFDSAAKALTAISRDVKDIPPELIAELVDKEFNCDMGLKAPREVEMAERTAQRQRIMAMQKELDKTRSARPSLGGMRRQGLLGGSLRARRLQRQQESQTAKQLQATVDGYTWSYRVNNGEAEIVSENSGKFSCAVSPAPTGNLAIPSTLNGVSVTSIGQEAFKECGRLMSVVIPECVRHIGYGAFGGCGALKSVTIPEGVTSILGCAFRGCGGLKSVTIPSTVTYVAHAVFADCAELKQVKVDEGNQKYVSVDGVLYTKDRMVLVQCPGGLESVTLLPELKSIYWHAFNGCNKLKAVEIPPSVTKIDPCAFYHNEGLTSVTIPPGVTSIGHRAFDGCKGLSSVTISSNVTTIANAVFYQCAGLTSVTIPPGIRNIEAWAFGRCDGLSSVTISEGVTNIAELAFLECGRLTSVVIPASVKSMGESAFGACDELTSVTMRGEKPDSGDKVFAKCGKLKSIHVPASAKSWAGMKEWQGIALVFDAK